MFRSLRIKNLAVLEDVAIEFGPGLNLLTGETGAGKSILVDALGLAAGGRADSGMVRQGAPSALVEAVIDLTGRQEVRDLLEERGIPLSEDGLLIRRQVGANGGGRAFMNDSSCTVTTLREVCDLLIDLLGQHEHRSLLQSRSQLDLLDKYGGQDDRLQQVAESCTEVEEAERALQEAVSLARERRSMSEHLRSRIAEIEAVDPVSGELQDLDRERNVLRNAGRIAELAEAVVEGLYTGEPSATTLAAEASRKILELEDLDSSLSGLAARVESARLEMEDAGAAIRDYLDGAEFDPGRLEQIERRRADIERLLGRYGRDIPEVLAVLEQDRRQLASLDDSGKTVSALRAGLEEACDRYVARCAELAEARGRAASRLAPAVESHFSDLAMPAARFDISLIPASGRLLKLPSGREVTLNSRGTERAEFRFAANPGEGWRSMTEAVSGGELSRLMLAIHGEVGGSGRGRVKVFDEVDAGIGGSTADAIGRRLAGLAAGGQVLCITHLPQVAAYAERHYSVKKRVQGGRTRVHVVHLDHEQRVEELSRMLGGRKTTPASRKNAVELIDAAERFRAAAGGSK